MLTDFLSAQNTWVFSKNEDPQMPVGRIIDVVINPDSGVFVAVWIRSTQGLKLITPHDIIYWNDRKLIITDENDLSAPEDLPRLQPIIKREVAILKTPVFSGKKYLGRVKNFSFDTLSPRILTLIVRSGMLWWKNEKIIPRNKILQITETGIFISENLIPFPSESTLKKENSPAEIEQPLH